VALMLLALSAVDPGLLWRPSLQELLLGLMALWGAFVLRFLLQTLSSMLCFWSERAAALDRLLVIPYLFLSGLVAPLDTFPPAVQRFALATPFPAMVDFPARLLSGLPVDLGGGYLSLLIWCLILSPLCCWGWQRGLRRYGAMGA
jgi:ABC-2 type transport system permease protein